MFCASLISRRSGDRVGVLQLEVWWFNSVPPYVEVSIYIYILVYIYMYCKHIIWYVIRAVTKKYNPQNKKKEYVQDLNQSALFENDPLKKYSQYAITKPPTVPHKIKGKINAVSRCLIHRFYELYQHLGEPYYKTAPMAFIYSKVVHEHAAKIFFVGILNLNLFKKLTKIENWLFSLPFLFIHFL